MFEHDDDPGFWAEDHTTPLSRLSARLRPAGSPPPSPSRAWPSGANVRDEATALPPVRRTDTALLDATLEFHLDDFDEFAGYSTTDRTEPIDHPHGTRRRPATTVRRPSLRRPSLALPTTHGGRRIAAMLLALAVAAPVAWALRGDDSTSITAATEPAVGPVDQGIAPVDPAVAALPVAPAAPECGLIYTVVAGDYWISIADRAGTTLDALLTANAATADSLLLPGNSVCLPAGAAVPTPMAPAPAATPAAAPAATTPAPTCGQQYTIRSGDSWSGIAAKAKVTTTQLLDVNSATTRTVLLPGRTVCLPVGATIAAPTPAAPAPVTSAPSVACTKRYTIVSGDSWSGIAAKVKITTTQLLAANNATTGTVLLPGRTVCLPANATLPTPRPSNPTPAPYVPPRTYSQAEVIQIIRDVWPDHLEAKAIEIANRESRYNPLSQNWCCYGVFQIYFTVHQRWLAGYGVTSASQLLDPNINIRMALVVYQRSNSWAPWGG